MPDESSIRQLLKQTEIPGDMDLAKKLLKLGFQQQRVTFEDGNEIHTES